MIRLNVPKIGRFKSVRTFAEIIALAVFASYSLNTFGATNDKNTYFTEYSFKYRPSSALQKAYRMDDPMDEHRLFVPKKIDKSQAYPIVIGFHGQPKRGKNPRDYSFQKAIRNSLYSIYKSGTKPFILVLPVFRFYGQNWPGFDPGAFRKAVESELEELGIRAESWHAFGHSGAAGCGGEGLNAVHRMKPANVGFFDTCLGKGWQQAIRTLQDHKIATINIHSVETAGFRPKQRPEYQSKFDFGRAYGPLGMSPVTCEGPHPGERLRNQPYRCAATPDGIIRGFVVDTGEGQAAHEAVLTVAFRYFLLEVLSLRK